MVLAQLYHTQPPDFIDMVSFVVSLYPLNFAVRIAKQLRKLILLYELVYHRNSTWSLVLKNKTFKKPFHVPVKGVLAGLLGVEAIPQCPLAVPDFSIETS